MTGTAATGLAIAGATVTGKCKVGTGTATTLADGTFSLVVKDGQLPCLLQITNPADGTKMHTVASGAGSSAIANITPLTEMVTSRVLGKEPNVFFAVFDATVAAKKVTTASIQAAQTDVGLLLTGTVDTAAITDFISAPLKAATKANITGGNSYDKLLDALKLKLSSAQMGTLSTALANNQTVTAIKQTVNSLTTSLTSPPVARAGTDQSVVTGTIVTLDASASSTSTGSSLTYTWTLLSKPAGSSAALSSLTSVKPTFTSDVAGTYVVSLTVNDGKVSSSAATVTVTASTANAAPAPTITSITSQQYDNIVQFFFTFDKNIDPSFSMDSVTVKGANKDSGIFNINQVGTTGFMLYAKTMAGASSVTVDVPIGAFKDTSATPVASTAAYSYTCTVPIYTYALNYSGDWMLVNIVPDGTQNNKSAQGGDFGVYVGTSASDTPVNAQFWWGRNYRDNISWGWGLNVLEKRPKYLGGYVNAPNNGLAMISNYNRVNISVTANRELLVTQPKLDVLLIGPTTGTGSSAYTPELTSSVKITPQTNPRMPTDLMSYSLPLNAFIFKNSCAYATTAESLAAGVRDVPHIPTPRCRIKDPHPNPLPQAAEGESLNHRASVLFPRPLAGEG